MSARLHPATSDDFGSLVGKRGVLRPDVRRLIEGRGCYVDDIVLPRMVHVFFVRSPYAHARIISIDVSEAEEQPGVIKVVNGREIAKYCSPWQGVLTNLEGMKSATQHALAIDRACWQGEPVVAIVAETRALAEDAAEFVDIDWEDLPVVADKEAALATGAPVIHPELGDNLCYQRSIDTGGVDAVFAEADHIIEDVFEFERQTPVSLEPRSLLADYNAGDERLNVHMSSQAPHMMQFLLARHLGLQETKVRVKVPDMGGGFGLKIHIFGDEMATAALSIMLNRPVKYIADRLESFISDTHSREHTVKARLAFGNDGAFLAWDVDDLCGAGAYSVYPRGSVNESKHIVNLTGIAYASPHYRARCRVAFQNKAMLGQYRAVGHPIACSVTEGLVDQAARVLGMDPLEIRIKNYIPEDAYPCKRPGRPTLEGLSQRACARKLSEMLDYEGLRAEQKSLRETGVYRGIGFANFIEMSNPSSATYGMGDAPITSQDGCTIRLNAQGTISCAVGVVEIGQGALTIIAQIAASTLGLAMEDVHVLLADTDCTPYGGGNWGSRGAGISGEATYQAAKALRDNILSVAAFLLGKEPDQLILRNGDIVEKDTGMTGLSLRDFASKVYFRTDLFPKDLQPEMVVTRHYSQKDLDGIATNGIQASLVEVNVETGDVAFLGHWVVHDCGTIINPDLVDEQIRGAVVQGLGAATGESCLYSPEGQLLNGSLAEYLVPLASGMPEIEVAHVVTPTRSSELGAKGVAEAGAAGAPAAVMNAINDALSPFNVHLSAQPFTPENVLRALGKF